MKLRSGRTSSVLFGCVVACAALAVGDHARATTALPGASTASELRVAYAQTPKWTTVWASARLKGEPGPFGVVLPLPEGALVDISSDAWFEALEAATAPRVVPPEGLSPHCPGESGPAHPFEITSSLAHDPTSLPETITLASSGAEVVEWVAAQGLAPDPSLAPSLAGTGAAKFLCVRFTASDGITTTPTLRVAAPSGLGVLPFSITRAGASDLRVTTWVFAPGRASLAGATAVNVPDGDVVWNADSALSTYVKARAELLAGDADRVVVESAGHGALVDPVSFADGDASIEALAPAYLERASAYGNALPNPDPCIDAAVSALGSKKIVGPVCPRGDLAELAGDCVASPPALSELDPATLTCGSGADDLALALAGQVPADAWLTRHTFVIEAAKTGEDRAVALTPSVQKTPLVTASAVDLSDCFGGAGGEGGAASTGGGPTGFGGDFTGTGNPGTGNTGNDGAGNSGNTGAGNTDDPDPDYDPGPSVDIDTSGCSCVGPGPVDTYETAGSGDGCDGGGTSSADDCSGDTYDSGDDCDSGSAGGDDCDSGSAAGDSCDGGDVAADGCDGGSASSDCAVGRQTTARRRAAPRLSAMTLALFALVLPLRRRGTRKSRRERE